MEKLKIEKPVARPFHDKKYPFSVDDSGAVAEYIVHDPDHMPDLGLGATVLIWDRENVKNQDVFIAGQIIGLRSISPFNPERDSMLYQRDEKFQEVYEQLDKLNGPHTHQPMVVRVALNRVLTMSAENTGQFMISPVQKPPSAISRLFFPNIDENTDGNRPPSLKEILNIKTTGIPLGMIGFGNAPYEIEDKFLPYNWDIGKLDNKHTFIVGESGSGKTVFLKNLAYQIRKFGKENNDENRVIMLDVQGDISQLLLWDMDNIIQPRSAWQKRVDQDSGSQIEEFLGPFNLLIPETSDGLPPDVAQLMKLAKQRQNVEVSVISLRMQDIDLPSELSYLFRTNSDQVPLLLDDIAEGLTKSKEDKTISRYETALGRLLSRNSGSQILMPTSGISYYRSTFEAARRALRSLRDYFDLDQDALDDNNSPLDKLYNRGTTILYLDHLSQDEKFMWEMQLVKWLYVNKSRMSNTFVFIDEAHQVIPKNEGTSNKEIFKRLRGNFEKLAREGRKYRLNLVLSTQSPKDLHEIVPEQCPTKIVMKINTKNAKAATIDDHLAQIASSFTQGQFWIQSPFNGTPEWVRVHSVAPPIPHEPMNFFRTKLEDKALNSQ